MRHKVRQRRLTVGKGVLSAREAADRLPPLGWRMTISGFLCLVMSSKAAGFARLAYDKQPSTDLKALLFEAIDRPYEA